jgi:predicted nucleotidyltransferase
VLSKTEAIQKARLLQELLEKQEIPVQKIFLFGSSARDTTHQWSDIDIAIICSEFLETPFKEYCTIARHAYAIDPRIALLYFRPEHFANPLSSVVREVQKEGIVIE